MRYAIGLMRKLDNCKFKTEQSRSAQSKIQVKSKMGSAQINQIQIKSNLGNAQNRQRRIKIGLMNKFEIADHMHKIQLVRLDNTKCLNRIQSAWIVQWKILRTFPM